MKKLRRLEVKFIIRSHVGGKGQTAVGSWGPDSRPTVFSTTSAPAWRSFTALRRVGAGREPAAFAGGLGGTAGSSPRVQMFLTTASSSHPAPSSPFETGNVCTQTEWASGSGFKSLCLETLRGIHTPSAFPAPRRRVRTPRPKLMESILSCFLPKVLVDPDADTLREQG